MEYTATAFAEPLKRVFAEIHRPMKELTVDFHSGSKYFVQSIEYRSEITPWFDQFCIDQFLESATFVAQQVRRLQAGSLHLYLLYIAIVLTFYSLSQGGSNFGIRPRTHSSYVFALALAPLAVGFVRWLKARMQNRQGVRRGSLLELVKLLGKEVVVSKQASWLFHCVPHIVFASTLR